MFLTRRAVLLVCGLLCLSACPSSSAPDAAQADTPAILDAPEPSDVADVSEDTAVEDTLADLGNDAEPLPDGLLFPDLEWERLEGLPEHCVAERAVDPIEAFEVRWLDCPDAPGCRYLEMPELPEFVRPRSFGGTFDGEQAYLHFWYRRREPGPSGQLVQFLVGSEQAAPVFAIRHWSRESGNLCAFGALSAHPEVAAFIIFTSAPERSHIFHAPLSEIGNVQAPWGHIDAFIQQSAVSPTTFVGWGGGPLYIVERDRVRFVEATPEVFGAPQAPHVVGHQVLWEDWPGLTGTRLVGATIDEGPRVLWAPDGWDIKRTFVRADGLVAWTQSRDRQPEGHYGVNELWSAQLSGSELREPTFVRSFARGEVPLPVDGPELYSDDGVVFDLNDGTQYVIDIPGLSLNKMLASSADELFFSGGVGTQGTFIRLQRSVYLVNGTTPEP